MQTDPVFLERHEKWWSDRKKKRTFFTQHKGYQLHLIKNIYTIVTPIYLAFRKCTFVAIIVRAL